MPIESLYFNSFRHGRPPKIQHLSQDDLNNTSVPLRLMLGCLLGCCGHRLMSTEKIGDCGGKANWIWYWPRGTGDWWHIPSNIHEQVKTETDDGKTWLALDVKKKLEANGFPVSVADSRVFEIINLQHEDDELLSPKLRDRVAALAVRRNFCQEFEQVILDWLIIELVWPFVRKR